MQFNLFITFLSLAFLISLALAIFIGIKKKDPVKTELFMVMAAITIWCFASLFEAVFTDLGIKIIFTKISYLGVVTSPIFFFFFISRYTNLDYWLTRKNKTFLFIIPAYFFHPRIPLHGQPPPLRVAAIYHGSGNPFEAH